MAEGSNHIFTLDGKVAIITGGTGVIGGSFAEQLLKVGATVVILNLNEENINRKIEDLKKYSDRVCGFVCNVLDTKALEKARDRILENYGKIDILINAAGGNLKGATQTNQQQIFDLGIDSIDEVIQLNLHGTIYPSLIFGKSMAENGSGSIINISSMATFSSITRVLGYSIAKSGINTFTQWLASELARKYGDKVRVNAIAPGFFIGNQNRKLLLNKDGSLTERGEKIIERTPMGRFGDIKELTGAMKFLCSDASSFVTGVVLPIDGGFSSYSGV